MENNSDYIIAKLKGELRIKHRSSTSKNKANQQWTYIDLSRNIEEEHEAIRYVKEQFPQVPHEFREETQAEFAHRNTAKGKQQLDELHDKMMKGLEQAVLHDIENINKILDKMEKRRNDK